jgi:hypothetical protein
MNSLSTIQVRDQNGNHTANLLAEVSFGSEPRLVALSPDDNSIDGRTDTFRFQGDDFRDALALP